MKNWILSAFVCALFFSSVAAAESATTDASDYRIPIFGNIEFEAEHDGGHKVFMSWSPFEGYRDENFAYYKVVRSYTNINPVYPEDPAIGYVDSLGETRFTDQNAHKSAYYRVCVITDVKGRHCSKAIWIEVEKNSTPSCKNFAFDGTCEDEAHEAEKREKAEKMKQERDEAKARFEAKKAEEKKQFEARKAEKKAQLEAQKKEREAKAAAKKAEMQEKKEANKESHKAKKEQHQDERWTKLYEKLNAWLERFGARLENSDMSSQQKVEKIEQIQARFYAWEEGKEVRMRIVDHLDETLNAWKEEYSQNAEFGDIDNFLEGLLDD